MTWILLAAVLFLLLLLLPILLGVFWYYRNSDSVLMVRQNRKRDPRYFAKSFDNLFLKAWAERKNGTLKMSRPEKYLLADEKKQEEYPAVCDTLIVVENEPFCPPEKIHFKREIYAWKDARFQGEAHLRAVRTRGNLLLGRGTQLDRWADADGTVAVYDDCDLGISVTAGVAISIGKNCKFRRLYAPAIHLGTYPDQLEKPSYLREKRIYRMEGASEKKESLRHISRSVTDETGLAAASFVTRGKVVIDEGIIVQGNVRTRRGVQLAERSVICGSLFAEKDVYLSRNSTVLGSVFTQGNIYCETGVVVGQEGRISSMIARGKIVFEEDCFVYGYVSNEAGGMICPVNQDDKVPEEELSGMKEQYLIWDEPDTLLVFEDQKDFEQVDSQGFRHDTNIQKVVVPDGVHKIPESMFFDCRGLETVELPASLEEIGDYAFADCVNLRSINLGALEHLRQIGRSAFDGCRMLEEVVFPKSLEKLGPAAFCNCVGLKQVKVPEDGALHEIESHCFQNCSVQQPVLKRPLQTSAVLESAQEEGVPDSE